MKKFCSFVIAVLFFTVTGFSQLTGVKNIPGDYADLNAAITASYCIRCGKRRCNNKSFTRQPANSAKTADT